MAQSFKKRKYYDTTVKPHVFRITPKIKRALDLVRVGLDQPKYNQWEYVFRYFLLLHKQYGYKVPGDIQAYINTLLEDLGKKTKGRMKVLTNPRAKKITQEEYPTFTIL